MKKIVIFAVIMTMMMLVLTGCQGKKSTNTENNANELNKGVAAIEDAMSGNRTRYRRMHRQQV